MIITSSHVMDLLGSCLLEAEPSEQNSANYHQNIQDAMTVFPKLQTGLDVNVKFCRQVHLHQYSYSLFYSRMNMLCMYLLHVFIPIFNLNNYYIMQCSVV